VVRQSSRRAEAEAGAEDMTKMTASQATSMGGRFVDKTYVALRRLKVGDSYRQPGELVPEAADWIDKVRNLMLEQQQIEAVNLVTDDAREAFARQWDQERTARFEASKVAQKTAARKDAGSVNDGQVCQLQAVLWLRPRSQQ
jgi:hypothetical protein